MNWTLAIDHNKQALLRLVAELFAMVGLLSGTPTARLSGGVRRAVLWVLRPAESAARRLIVVEALDVDVPPHVPRAAPVGGIPRGNGERVCRFNLFDPAWRVEPDAGRRKYAKHAPRIFFFDGSDPVFEPLVETPAPAPDKTVDTGRLLRRLDALKRALENVPKQARRLARMQARRAMTKKRLIGPLRPGRPPGHRARVRHEVDEPLTECHILALRALSPPDTS